MDIFLSQFASPDHHLSASEMYSSCALPDNQLLEKYGFYHDPMEIPTKSAVDIFYKKKSD